MIPPGRDEKGQALLLVVGFTLVSFAVAGMAVDGARLWLLRRGLQNSVDAASLDAAAHLDANAFYASGGASRRLDPSRAVTAARELVGRRGVADEVVISVEGEVVLTRAKARLETSFLKLVGVQELWVAADATAAPVFGEVP